MCSQKETVGFVTHPINELLMDYKVHVLPFGRVSLPQQSDKRAAVTVFVGEGWQSP